MSKEEKYRELIEDMLTNLDGDNVDIRDYEVALKEIDETHFTKEDGCVVCVHEKKSHAAHPCWMCTYPSDKLSFFNRREDESEK